MPRRKSNGHCNTGKTGFRKKSRTFFQSGDDVRRSQKDGGAPKTGPEEKKHYSRLPRELYDSVNHHQEAHLTPTVLRPDQQSLSRLEEAAKAGSQQVLGNRVVAMSKLCSAISLVCNQHHAEAPSCHYADFAMPADGETRLGLGVDVNLECKNCQFRQRVRLYEEVEESKVKAGPNIPKLNNQLCAFMTQSSVSYADVRLLLATLDIPPIAECTLTKHVNRISPIWQEMNEQEMNNSARKLKDILLHQQESPVPDIICMADTVYNNPPKGRAMSQPGTQCSTPMVEAMTDRNMILALTTSSKLCHKGVRCNANHGQGGGSCTANYPVHRPMGNAETTALVDNIERVEAAGVKVTGLITDGIAKEYTHPDIKHTEKLHCNVHCGRGQRRKVTGANLSNTMMGLKDKKLQSRYKSVLARAISTRATLELSAATRRHGTGPEFLAATDAAKLNILNCFQGQHGGCAHSGVCKANKTQDFTPSYLPHKQYLTNITEEDRKMLQSAIDYRLDRRAAWQQRHLKNTNAVEALHLRTLKVCPKFKTYRRNYGFRSHSAAHSHAVGHYTSLYTFLQRSKMSPNNTKHLLAMQKKEKYLQIRRKTVTFRRRRRELSFEKQTLKQFSCLGIENGVDDEDVMLDHSY